MLRIAPAKTSAGDVKKYYLHAEREHALADYYTKSEAIGQWHGKAAARLGLNGQIFKEHFDLLCDNQHPATGQQLTPRNAPGRRVGFDVSFNVPKSLSLLWAVNHDYEIIEAIEKAANQTMKQMEQDAQTRVRAAGQYKDRKTGELAWASFVHHTSRPTKSNPVPDPQLHLHAFVFNCTWDQVEDRWKAVQPGRMHQSAYYFESIFHTKLAAEVQRLGYPIMRSGRKGWEIAGVDRNMITAFSNRTREIESRAQTLGILDGDAKGKLGAMTRLKKADHYTLTQLRSHWLSRMTPQQKDILHSARQRTTAPTIKPDQALDHAVKHCFERSAVIEDRRLMAAALWHGVGSVDVDDVQRVMSKRDWLNKTDEADRTWLSTQGVLDEELAMCKFAREGRGQYAPLGDVDRVIHRRPGFTLNAQQQAACRHVWSSHDRVIAIRGAAGTGKTAMIQEAITGIQATNTPIVALAPSASASRGVLRDAGIEDADTVALFLQNDQLQEKARDGVIWVDEASLVGTRSLGEIFKKAQTLNARIVLSGDPMQHKSVEAGEPPRVLEKYAGIRPAEITQILRQKNAYRDAVQAFSQGKAVQGLKRLEKMGAIHEIAGELRFATMAEDYVNLIAKGKDVLVVSPTHGEGDQVTRAIRLQMKQQGRLSNDEHQRTCDTDMQWTEAEKSDSASYETGQRLYFHKACKGIAAGSWWQISDVNHDHIQIQSDKGKTCALPLDKAKRFSVYRPGNINLAKGDLIRCTQNTWDAGRKRRINNGTVYKVAGFNPQNGNMRVKPINGAGHSTEIAADNGLFTYGYCTTSHASQGKTVDVVLISQGQESLGASSARQLYVSVSRGKDAVHIYTDDQSTLHKAAMEQESLQSALDLNDAQKKAKLNFYQEHASRQSYSHWQQLQHWLHNKWQQQKQRVQTRKRHALAMTRSYTYER